MSKQQDILVRKHIKCPRCGAKILFCRSDIDQFRCACGQVFYPPELATGGRSS